MRCFSRLSLTPLLLALIWVQPIGAQDSEQPLGAQDSEKINSSLGTAVAVPVDPTSGLATLGWGFTAGVGYNFNRYHSLVGEFRPSRPQGVSPGFRASLVQPFASRRPFHSHFAQFPRVGDPPPLALATPRLRQEAFGMYVHAAARFRGKGQCNRPRRKHP